MANLFTVRSNLFDYVENIVSVTVFRYSISSNTGLEYSARHFVLEQYVIPMAIRTTTAVNIDMHEQFPNAPFADGVIS